MEEKMEKNKPKLNFGTGGMRGIMGDGEDKMNDKTIARLTKAVAMWLIAKNENAEKPEIKAKSVAISYDSRINSEHFANLSAEVLTKFGIDVYIYDRLMPTPSLSFAVRENGCDAGIMVTASHNKSAYNGYKVYGKSGAQIGEEDADEIVSFMENIPYETALEIKETQLESKGKINLMGEAEIQKFTDAVLASRTLKEENSLSDISLVYTPLNGAGLVPVTTVLKACGIGGLHYVEEQKKPDGNFPTCPYPNPEKEEALALGLEKLRASANGKKSADALIATDPDGDRLGAAILTKNGEIRILSGNEVGVLFIDYLIQKRVKTSEIKSPVVFSTIVSTKLTEALCEKNDVKLVKTLTGFKHMCAGMTKMEENGELNSFLFAFEESIGYLPAPYTMDKDGITSALLFAEMLAYYKKAGKTLQDRLEELFEEYGYYGEKTLDFVFEGEEGAAKIKDIMAKFRVLPAKDDFTDKIDYMNDDTNLPKSDVLEFKMSSGSLIVRPSGTEPKIKFYILIKADTNKLREDAIRKLEEFVKEMLFDDKKKIGIIFGGKSSEHQISCMSAASIYRTLKKKQYELVCIGISKKGEWRLFKGSPEEMEKPDWEKYTENFDMGRIKDYIDFAFPVLHGRFGEDGTIQGFFEMMDLPYAGCNVLGSALAMDKAAAKMLFERAGLSVCDYVFVHGKDFMKEGINYKKLDEKIAQIEKKLKYPVFVKPVNMGSSVGISKAKDKESLKKALIFASEYDERVLVEQGIDARELEIGIIGNHEIELSSIGEIIASSEFYDYNAKYLDDGKTSLCIPADISEKTKKEIEEMAKKAYAVLDCAGLSRLDFFLEKGSGKVYINEVNSLPGFTKFSMFPLLFEDAGMSYAELAERIIKFGYEKYYTKNNS